MAVEVARGFNIEPCEKSITSPGTINDIESGNQIPFLPNLTSISSIQALIRLIIVNVTGFSDGVCVALFLLAIFV